MLLTLQFFLSIAKDLVHIFCLRNYAASLSFVRRNFFNLYVQWLFVNSEEWLICKAIKLSPPPQFYMLRFCLHICYMANAAVIIVI